MTKHRITGSRTEVRKFGLLFTGISVIIGGYLVYKGSPVWAWFAGAAAFFLVTGLLGYPILRPIYLGWMKLAFVLGWLNTRILLGLFFFLVMTPVGLVIRIFGRDLLDRRANPSAQTYWKRREDQKFDEERCEHLF